MPHGTAAISRLIDANRGQFASAHGSLLVGDLGTLLVAMGLRPDAATADVIYERARRHDAKNEQSQLCRPRP